MLVRERIIKTMVKPYKKLDERKKFDGFLIDAFEADFETDAGIFTAEVLKHPGGAVIAATHDDEYFYVVDQFRFGTEMIMTEFPAGKTDPGEIPLNVAKRELQEEIGYRAQTIVPLGIMHPTPAYLTEALALFYATDLEFVGQNLDEGEELHVHQLKLSEIEAKIMSNEITDAKTIALAMKLRLYLQNKKV